MNVPVNDVHVVLPNDIDDPARPSGGNVYDRRVCDGLAAAGWSVREHPVRGAWPRPEPGERAELARLLAAVPDDAVVLLDGLIASAVPEVLRPHAARLRLVILVHQALVNDEEREALSTAAAVVTTSEWSRRGLLARYPLAPDRVHVARPGVEEAPLSVGSADGSALLCVAAVSPHKGHDVLIRALAAVADRAWHCVCVGPLDRDPRFVDDLRRTAEPRISFVGPLTGPELAAHYATADLLVLPSRGETYGMVVTEALARGTPVLVSDVDGLPEAVGRASDGRVPGMLVPPDDPPAVARALRRWFAEPALRARLRQTACDRRAGLAAWSVTAATVSGILAHTLTKVSVGR
jgi:glycosyltransferase involved in cell wall biosynthesis